MEQNRFNQIARQYDTEERKDLAKIILSAVEKELQNQKGKTLLDYGCGTGLIGLELFYLVDQVLFIDSSESMLEILKEKIVRTKIDQTKTKVFYSDFTKIESNVKADIILASLVLLHVPDTITLLKQFNSILNADGKLIIVDFDKNENINHPNVHNGFAHLHLKSLLTEVGFKNIEIKTFHHGKNIFMNQDASLLISTSSK
ncbi:class I SAM-dependent methyltransferase [Leptospira congkakensis]|uniref:Class I SAM-dependent methyltransferase n=1 Tax=Leptospira congkakensis TaxID=2484932 RepID=A0A4Z1A5P5_9LEPT|nr:class I SAM-dependent methyltransferase [Leptospira congkakensis]TGL86224.1 class I SAM-dependent methyltransferase [Leptospira congkakensis]TGL94232.1 class I SAM-dependent methyltransferase [Leptospira congkakensis]TGL94358.1 class I SAM-dependent methyltransferase [Leptospira congkakensis]